MQFLDADTALPEGTLTLANTDDVLAHADDLRAAHAVALDFPAWTDGRAYSQAVVLRARLRFAGTVVATGEVVADMLPLLRRCGFDAVRLAPGQRREAAERALGWFDGHYQRDATQPLPRGARAAMPRPAPPGTPAVASGAAR
jgi:uncharacterized protein (DUF934 family)